MCTGVFSEHVHFCSPKLQLTLLHQKLAFLNPVGLTGVWNQSAV